jgi:hypothetical protein
VLKFLNKHMKLTRLKWFFLSLIFLVSTVLFSCSKKSREGLCKGNNTYRGYVPKKNKSRYNQKYSYKTRSVRKDYVIKNGIAH